MTFIDMLNKFGEEFPHADIDDYRPACAEFVNGKAGITVWLKNGDMIIYCPKEVVDKH